MSKNIDSGLLIVNVVAFVARVRLLIVFIRTFFNSQLNNKNFTRNAVYTDTLCLVGRSSIFMICQYFFK